MTNEMNVNFDAEISVSAYGEAEFTLAAAKAIADELAKSMADWKYKGELKDEAINVELLRFMPEDTESPYYEGSEAGATYKLTYSCKLYPENNSNDCDTQSEITSICQTAELDLCEIGSEYNLSIDTTKITRDASDDWYFDDNGDLIITVK